MKIFLLTVWTIANFIWNGFIAVLFGLVAYICFGTELLNAAALGTAMAIGFILGWLVSFTSGWGEALSHMPIAWAIFSITD